MDLDAEEVRDVYIIARVNATRKDENGDDEDGEEVQVLGAR